MNTRTLRRTRKEVASTLEDVSDKIAEVADTLREETEKAGGEVLAELAALPEQLEGVRRSVLGAVEPYRPPKRYRPYVQLGVLVVVAAAATAIVMRRRHAAQAATTTLTPQAASPGPHDDGRRPPTTGEAAETSGRQGRGE